MTTLLTIAALAVLYVAADSLWHMFQRIQLDVSLHQQFINMLARTGIVTVTVRKSTKRTAPR